MPYLTKRNAQKIIQRISRIVPYPISIISTDGELLAGSASQGKTGIYKSAVRAVELEDAYIVYRDGEQERQGISFPIRYHAQIEGVVEINGDLDEIIRIGQAVVTLAELMMENDAYHKSATPQESRMSDFFYEWSYRSAAEYSARFRETAEYFGVDLTMRRIAVIVRMRRIRFSIVERMKTMLRDGEYLVRQRLDSFTILLAFDESVHERLAGIMEISPDFERAFMGVADTDAARAVATAAQTMTIADRLHDMRRIIGYQDIELEHLLLAAPAVDAVERIVALYEEHDTDESLRNTIICYARRGEKHAAVCDALFIHRNTLNYRLEKIRALTGRNPRNGRDLTLLYAAALRSRTDTGQEKQVTH